MLRLMSQSSAGLRTQPYPRSPDLVLPGHLHGTGCLSARAMDTGFPTVAWRLCSGLACAWALVSDAPRHSWLGCRGLCLLVCAIRLNPATPGWGVQGGCVCFGSGFGCAPPLLAGVFGCVCACVCAPLVPRHSWLGCTVRLCVLGLGFWLRPASLGWGVGVCVFVYALCLYSAAPGWGVRRRCVCSGSGFGCAPPLLAGVLGCVCACLRARLVPRLSWLGCVVWVCVLGLGFRLRPATPGWDDGVCVCLCARSACTPPLLAGLCCVGVCAWAQVSAAPRLPWLGCCGVLVCVLALLVPCQSWLGCAVWVCVLELGFRLRIASSDLGYGVCVFVCSLRLYLATPGWGVRRGCVCFDLGFGCAPPLLAGVMACLCVRVRPLLVPRHSWLGCAVWVSALGLRLQLRPATPGSGIGVCLCVLRLYPVTPRWGVLCGRVCFGLRLRLHPTPPCWSVGVCVRSCARFACTPPLLAGVYGAGVCAWARVSAAPCHSWLACWGLCALACALFLYPATPGFGVRCRRVCLGLGFGCAPPLVAGL